MVCVELIIRKFLGGKRTNKKKAFRAGTLFGRTVFSLKAMFLMAKGPILELLDEKTRRD